jgi:hypothetical protein
VVRHLQSRRLASLNLNKNNNTLLI